MDSTPDDDVFVRTREVEAEALSDLCEMAQPCTGFTITPVSSLTIISDDPDAAPDGMTLEVLLAVIGTESAISVTIPLVAFDALVELVNHVHETLGR